MPHLRQLILAASLLLLSGAAATAAAYGTERGLYRDCAAGVASAENLAAEARLEQCSDFLHQVLNAWNLEQDSGICARHVGSDLPRAYVAYWRGRGVGLIGGELTSAEKSVTEFLDSEKVRCPVPDPKTHAP